MSVFEKELESVFVAKGDTATDAKLRAAEYAAAIDESITMQDQEVDFIRGTVVDAIRLKDGKVQLSELPDLVCEARDSARRLRKARIKGLEGFSSLKSL